ncbi:MAG TPA: hypothetical protein VML75_09710 [Kofleriaceae bacterium]|nr:hypothetical protein [Kofleriaceae bacterium]
MSGSRLAILAVAALATALAGCPRGSGGKTPVIPNGTDGDALTIPATADTFHVLDELGARARRGDLASAWLRAHYLLDLFDDARFRNDARSRAALWKGLSQNEPDRGPAATDRAIAALEIEVDRVLELDRLHPGASAAKTLLAYDATPPRQRVQVLQRMIELKGAGNVPDVEANATLRLVAYCARALEDATRAAWAERPQIASHCLYPLYTADPEPYFHADPQRRPPVPRWRDLVTEVTRRLETIAGAARLAPTAAHLAAHVARLARDRGAELPDPLDPAGLPRADHAPPHDWTPVLTAPAADADLRALAGEVSLPLQGDGRGVVALALPASASRASYELAVRAASAAGAEAIELLYDTAQLLSVPKGDYWYGRLADNTVHRAGAVRIALGTEPRADGTPRRGPHEPRWDPSRATLGVHLVIGATRWTLVAPEGELASIAHDSAKGDPHTELRVALSRLRAAFPSEAGLLVFAEPDSDYLAIARAVQAAAYDDQGRALFPMLARTGARPKRVGDTLPRRLERRWTARVQIEPNAMQGSVAGVRACYQDRLESDPSYASTMSVQRVGTGARVVSGGGGKALDRCIEAAIGPAMIAGSVASANITLAPR